MSEHSEETTGSVEAEDMNEISTPRWYWPDLLISLSTAAVFLALAAVAYFCADVRGLTHPTGLLAALVPTWQAVLSGFVLAPVCILCVHLVKLVQVSTMGPDCVEFEPDVPVSQHVVESSLAGFGEEVLFRGALMPILGIFGSSLLFGLMHVERWRDLPYGFYAGCYGLLISLVYYYSGNLWTPIIIHAVNNYVAGNPPAFWSDLIDRVYGRFLPES